jgi:hypothetical protein
LKVLAMPAFRGWTGLAGAVPFMMCVMKYMAQVSGSKSSPLPTPKAASARNAGSSKVTGASCGEIGAHIEAFLFD